MADEEVLAMNPADDVIQKERRAVMKSDRLAASYHSHARGNLDDERGGRYAAEGSKATVVGTGSIAYPAQPAGSPWAKDECPPEPLIDGTGEGTVTGYEIDRPDVVSTSTALEVEEPPSPPVPSSPLAVVRGWRRRF